MLIERTERSLAFLADQLKAARVVIMACDTIYGFLGIVPDTEAEIRRIKGRSDTKPFIHLISDLECLDELAIVPESVNIRDFWPGPFTLILPLANGGTAGFRLPQNSSLRQLIRLVGAPLYSTSVNRAGETPLNNPHTIHQEFGDQVALVEDAGIYRKKKASTIINLSVRPPVLLRQGSGIVPPGYL